MSLKCSTMSENNLQTTKRNKTMKTQIRKSVFETNSSSVHSLTIYPKSKWKEFKNGKRLIKYDDEMLEKNIDEIKESAEFKEYLDENYPEHNNPQVFTEDDMHDALYEFMEEECLYDWGTYSENYEVLEEEVPDSDYVAVSIFQENY